jgi:catechol 2,3-dioxygenase-like lactoylglutathione lyase family enzyme
MADDLHDAKAMKRRSEAMDWKLEVVILPATDIDRSKQFYAEMNGFNVDFDNRVNNNFRVVKLTPHGSASSVTIGTGLSAGLQLVVADIEAAHAELVGRGVEVGKVQHMQNGEWVDGPGEPWNSFFFFKDPDGNDWAVQEKPGM